MLRLTRSIFASTIERTVTTVKDSRSGEMIGAAIRMAALAIGGAVGRQTNRALSCRTESRHLVVLNVDPCRVITIAEVVSSPDSESLGSFVVA